MMYAQQKWARFIKKDTFGVNARVGEGKSRPYLLKYQGTRDHLQKMGIKILRPLDKDHYIVKPSVEALQANLEDFYPVNDLWKLEDQLYEQWSAGVKIIGYLNITTDNYDSFLHEITQFGLGLGIHGRYNNILLLHLEEPSTFEQLLALSSVLSVDLGSVEPHEEAPLRDFNYNVNHINQIRDTLPGLNGEGLTVSIKEQQYDVTDIDFNGRHVPSTISSDQVANHATEMATIVAGGGNSSFQGRGVAWGALLTSSDFENTLPDDDEDYANLDVTVQNHSYGTLPENFYGASARAYDESANANPNLLHVFSAGNSGSLTPAVGPYAGVENFANLTGNFKMAKNLLTVGGVDTVLAVPGAISKGPAYDGRIKPELAAYSLTGSSSSAAVVSGIALLLQQAYEERHNVLPPSALLKSILVNSADDIGPKGVDYYAGYGNVNSFRALQTILENRIFSGAIVQGERQQFSITLPPNAKDLKVTIVWNDPAAEVNTHKALVHDLDMTVTHTSTNITYLPWVLNAYPHVDSLNLLPRRKVDRFNNIEQVTIENPEEGNYVIEVKGFDIALPSQQFYLAYQWDLEDQFTWTFPTGSDNLPQDGEFQSFFRWTNTFTGSAGRLDYSLDGGTQWISIDDQVDLAKNYYSWSPPDVYGLAKARMIIGDQTFETDDFVISRPLRARVGFNCADSLMLTWPRLEEATSYVISSPGSRYLEDLLQVSDTAVVLSKVGFPQALFTVTPFFEEKPGLRNLTFDYTDQGVGCYIINFFANLAPGVGADLSLDIGTIYRVYDVTFQRFEGDDFSDIFTVSRPVSTTLSYIDNNAKDKENIYRARIRFEGGGEVFTTNDTVFFLKTTVAVLFPVPAQQSGDLNIFLKDFEGSEIVFHLFNSQGQLLFKRRLAKERDSIPLFPYRPGFYLYEITAGGERQTGRIVIY